MAALVALSAPAAQAQSDAPKSVAVVAIQKYSGLIGDIDFLGELGGQVKSGQQLENLLKLFTQGQGLNGLDKETAWGAVVQTNGFDFAPIICLPVTDLDALMTTVQNAGVNVSDAGDGIQEIEMPQQSIYVKDGGKWAFVSNNVEMLGSAPADPAKMFGDLTGDYDVAVKVMVQNVPEMYRQIAVTQLKQGMEDGLERDPDETDEGFQLRKQIATQQVEQLVQLINESDEVMLGWTVDEAEGGTSLDVVYTMVPGSELARMSKTSGDATSRFTGFVKGDPAMSMLLAQKQNPEAMAAQRDQFEQMMNQARVQLNKEIEDSDDVPNEEAREVLKEVAGDILDALEATLLAGKIDAAMSVNIDPDAFTMVAGVHVLETAKIETSLKKLAALVESEPDAPTFDFDAETYQGVRLHHITVPVPADEEGPRRLFGDSLEVTIGADDKSLYLAAGRDQLEALKSAIDDSASAGEASVKPFEMVMSVEAFMKVGAAFAEGPQQPIIEMMAEKLSLNSENATHLRVTGAEIENGVKYRIEVEAGVLEAVGAAGQQARQAGAGADF